jgi:predicted regulator of Ras-like GTPase activity (Roadblock/LC7/MglB family)
VSVIEERLRALRDMDSVYGSVVFSASGATIARDLPPSFDQQLLQSVGKRISLMFEAFQVEGEELDSCVMRYAEHRLHLRRASWGLLMVVTGGQVNTPALRMAINLVLRRLDAPASSRSPAAPIVPPPLAPPPPASLPRKVPSYGPGSVPTPVGFHAENATNSLPASTEGRESVNPEDARDSSPDSIGRHVRMYRGRPVQE